VTITIIPVNDAPILTELVPQVMDEDSELTLPLSAADVDNADLVFNAISDNELVNVSISGDSMTIAPSPDHFGFSILTVIVSDGDLTDSDTLALTITAVNDSPVIAGPIGDVNLDEDSPGIILADLDTVFQDVDNELTFSHENSNEDLLTVSIHEVTHVVTVTFGNNANGTANLVFSAADDQYSITDEVIVTVNPVNDAPQLIVSSTPPFETNENEDLDISFTVSDVEDDALESNVVSGPFHGTYNTTTTDAGFVLTYSPDPGFFGNDNMIVHATELEGGLSSNQINISIGVFSQNDAPVVSSFEWSIMEDTSTEIILQGFDADGDPYCK